MTNFVVEIDWTNQYHCWVFRFIDELTIVNSLIGLFSSLVYLLVVTVLKCRLLSLLVIQWVDCFPQSLFDTDVFGTLTHLIYLTFSYFITTNQILYFLFITILSLNQLFFGSTQIFVGSFQSLFVQILWVDECTEFIIRRFLSFCFWVRSKEN